MGSVRIRAINSSKSPKFLRHDKSGVASTVGMILAILLFVSILGLVVNTCVPSWMNDNERNHMTNAIDQFGELKEMVDMMAMEKDLMNGSISTYAPITLGSNGVPLLATGHYRSAKLCA